MGEEKRRGCHDCNTPPRSKTKLLRSSEKPGCAGTLFSIEVEGSIAEVKRRGLPLGLGDRRDLFYRDCSLWRRAQFRL